MSPRRFSIADRCIGVFDQALRVLTGTLPPAGRPSPAGDTPDGVADAGARRLAAGLMRVNHAGEVSAQALYVGQSLSARNPATRERLRRSADEEIDHLHWCRERLAELGGRTSYLDPLWYGGSLCIGMAAGLAGDRINLGFVAETERQVVAHLDDHLQRLPPGDERSRRILVQMRSDEARHGSVARDAGAATLPAPVKRIMALASRVMTTASRCL